MNVKSMIVVSLMGFNLSDAYAQDIQMNLCNEYISNLVQPSNPEDAKSSVGYFTLTPEGAMPAAMWADRIGALISMPTGGKTTYLESTVTERQWKSGDRTNLAQDVHFKFFKDSNGQISGLQRLVSATIKLSNLRGPSTRYHQSIQYVKFKYKDAKCIPYEALESNDGGEMVSNWKLANCEPYKVSDSKAVFKPCEYPDEAKNQLMQKIITADKHSGKPILAPLTSKPETGSAGSL